jgi:hypothetical protein
MLHKTLLVAVELDLQANVPLLLFFFALPCYYNTMDKMRIQTLTDSRVAQLTTNTMIVVHYIQSMAQ